MKTKYCKQKGKLVLRRLLVQGNTTAKRIGQHDSRGAATFATPKKVCTGPHGDARHVQFKKKRQTLHGSDASEQAAGGGNRQRKTVADGKRNEAQLKKKARAHKKRKLSRKKEAKPPTQKQADENNEGRRCRRTQQKAHECTQRSGGAVAEAPGLWPAVGGRAA